MGHSGASRKSLNDGPRETLAQRLTGPISANPWHWWGYLQGTCAPLTLVRIWQKISKNIITVIDWSEKWFYRPTVSQLTLNANGSVLLLLQWEGKGVTRNASDPDRTKSVIGSCCIIPNCWWGGITEPPTNTKSASIIFLVFIWFKWLPRSLLCEPFGLDYCFFRQLQLSTTTTTTCCHLESDDHFLMIVSSWL